ncbi:MAG: sterol desaturase family protein [Roseovarius sp.]|nr:sterol desaturase family protein [Roseovarius sp.]
MEHESLIRFGVFITLFAILAAAESLAPRRRRTQPLHRRWITNWSIVILDAATLRLLALALPLLATGAALDAGQNGWGIMNKWDVPLWIGIPVTVLLFDFAVWAQHLLTHKIPILWRFHRVHHADRDIDVTTAIRFHPVEIAFSMLLKIGLIYVLGPPAVGIALFEIILNGTAMFNHSNLKLPLPFDAFLRRILVTPDMHRVHHSARRDEHDSNYGFALSLWDRLFKTYIPQPIEGHQKMTTGLEWQDDRPSSLAWSLGLPFFRK